MLHGKKQKNIYNTYLRKTVIRNRFADNPVIRISRQ